MRMYPTGYFPILACLVGILLSGVIVGTSAMLNKQKDESALGAFVGGFIDGAIGAVAVAAGLTTGVLQMTKLFPTTGNFKVDFVNNLALWSGPNTPIHMGGTGSIAAAVTVWFTYYGFPSANMIRKI